jgi:hypothetical protein
MVLEEPIMGRRGKYEYPGMRYYTMLLKTDVTTRFFEGGFMSLVHAPTVIERPSRISRDSAVSSCRCS